MRLFRTSTDASPSNARSRATTSKPGPGDATSPSFSVTRCASPPRLRIPARPRVIDQDAPHQACRNPEKVRAVLPPDASRVGQPEKRLIHQRRGLQGMSAAFAPHVPASQAAKLRLDERREPLEGVVFAVAPRPQQLGDRTGRLCRQGSSDMCGLAHILRPAPGLDTESRRSIVSGVFLTIFTPRTSVPAFQRAGGLTAVRWRERDDEDSTMSGSGWGGGHDRPGMDIHRDAAQSTAEAEGQQSLMAPDARVRGASARIVAVINEGACAIEDLSRAGRPDQRHGRNRVCLGRPMRARRAACLLLTITMLAGPVLRILVDPRKSDRDLMGSIGHELRHALEVLSHRTVRSDSAMILLFKKACDGCDVGLKRMLPSPRASLCAVSC